MEAVTVSSWARVASNTSSGFSKLPSGLAMAPSSTTPPRSFT